MPAIEINKASEAMLVRLRRLAEEHGSDLESEALECLEKGLNEREQIEAELRELREFRAQMKGAWVTDEEIRCARNEGRA